MVKVAILFLAGMVLIGMIGNVVTRGAVKRNLQGKLPFCPRCGRPQIGRGPCDCGRK